jgi:hypothetical protein
VITLKDSAEIKTTPEKLFDWFKNLDKHFEEWHPNHKKFVKVTGGTGEGDIITEPPPRCGEERPRYVGGYTAVGHSRAFQAEEAGGKGIVPP